MGLKVRKAGEKSKQLREPCVGQTPGDETPFPTSFHTNCNETYAINQSNSSSAPEGAHNGVGAVTNITKFAPRE